MGHQFTAYFAQDAQRGGPQFQVPRSETECRAAKAKRKRRAGEARKPGDHVRTIKPGTSQAMVAV